MGFVVEISAFVATDVQKGYIYPVSHLSLVPCIVMLAGTEVLNAFIRDLVEDNINPTDL